MGGRTTNAGFLEAMTTTDLKQKSQKDKDKKGKVRRGGKRIKNKLKKFKIMYSNLRGFKSKIESIKNIIAEEKPTIIALAETLIENDEKVKLEGYKTFKPAEKGSRGIMILVADDLKKITSIVMEDNTSGEQMWIQVCNGKVDLRIGLIIYAPQEKKTKVKELNKMYNMIKEQVDKGKQKNEKIMVLGDFNCKIGREIDGNKEKVTKGGRILMKLVKDMNLSLLNAHPKCQGLWTRNENGKISVLDYVLIEKQQLESVEEI